MLDLIAYRKGGELTRVEELSTISDLIADTDVILWLDALDPTKEEIEFLASEFQFHPLAIENYYSPHPRPRLDEYPGYFFLVTHVMSYHPRKMDVTPLELDLFVSEDYIVTLHKQPLRPLTEVADRWTRQPTMFDQGVGMLLYDILDNLVDSYFPVLDEIDLQLDEIEDEVFRRGEAGPVEPIFRLKRGLVMFRRIASPLRDAINSLLRRERPFLSEHDAAYLRDVYDHTLRIVDMVDTYRDILTSALDAYLTVVSNQLNSVMKSLTVAATVLISASLIAGIYGMNFRHMPELYWQYGYAWALGLMAGLSGVLLYYFKRIGWMGGGRRSRRSRRRPKRET